VTGQRPQQQSYSLRSLEFQRPSWRNVCRRPPDHASTETAKVRSTTQRQAERTVPAEGSHAFELQSKCLAEADMSTRIYAIMRHLRKCKAKKLPDYACVRPRQFLILQRGMCGSGPIETASCLHRIPTMACEKTSRSARASVRQMSGESLIICAKQSTRLPRRCRLVA
jgi:hypothetical protein